MTAMNKKTCFFGSDKTFVVVLAIDYLGCYFYQLGLYLRFDCPRFYYYIYLFPSENAFLFRAFVGCGGKTFGGIEREIVECFHRNLCYNILWLNVVYWTVHFSREFLTWTLFATYQWKFN